MYIYSYYIYPVDPTMGISELLKIVKHRMKGGTKRLWFHQDVTEVIFHQSSAYLPHTEVG